MLNGSALSSLILWGPPGSGKTTLARLIAGRSGAAFTELSAVTSGLPDVKKVIEQANLRRSMGETTLLFVDEIHRFNKAQQDAFLPHLENGTIILIGATTENPSFEVIGPLLSRARVVTLSALTPSDIEKILQKATDHLGSKLLEAEAAGFIAEQAGGDARVALGALETAAGLTATKITRTHAQQALGLVGVKYDKKGEYHYNLISAYIKSLRGSDADAALYYLVRMLAGGEDPKFIARRLIIFASEDIGLASSGALTLAVSTSQAIERIGLPEGRITLAHATVALAKAPKDRRVYNALGAAEKALAEAPNAEVPLHLRNASTKLMKDLGYGEGYEWAAGYQHPEGFLPAELAGHSFLASDNPPARKSTTRQQKA
jgi:putative ATPase